MYTFWFLKFCYVLDSFFGIVVSLLLWRYLRQKIICVICTAIFSWVGHCFHTVKVGILYWSGFVCRWQGGRAFHMLYMHASGAGQTCIKMNWNTANFVSLHSSWSRTTCALILTTTRESCVPALVCNFFTFLYILNHLFSSLVFCKIK